MFVYFRRVLSLIGVLLAITSLARGESPRLDAFGDPLPDGALYRLGTLRYRVGPNNSRVFPVFSANGKTLVLFRDSEPMRLLDVATGRLVEATKERLPKEGQFLDTAISRDRRHSVWNTGAELQIWEFGSGKHLRDLENPKERVRACAFRPDGKTLLALRNDGVLRQ